MWTYGGHLTLNHSVHYRDPDLASPPNCVLLLLTGSLPTRSVPSHILTSLSWLLFHFFLQECSFPQIKEWCLFVWFGLSCRLHAEPAQPTHLCDLTLLRKVRVSVPYPLALVCTPFRLCVKILHTIFILNTVYVQGQGKLCAYKRIDEIIRTLTYCCPPLSRVIIQISSTWPTLLPGQSSG